MNIIFYLSNAGISYDTVALTWTATWYTAADNGNITQLGSTFNFGDDLHTIREKALTQVIPALETAWSITINPGEVRFVDPDFTDILTN